MREFVFIIICCSYLSYNFASPLRIPIEELYKRIGPYDFPWTSIDGTVYIAKFQRTEFYENHLLFWLNAEKFKSLPTDQLQRAAFNICHNYIIHKGEERGVSETLLPLKAVLLPCISFHRLSWTNQFA